MHRKEAEISVNGIHSDERERTYVVTEVHAEPCPFLVPNLHGHAPGVPTARTAQALHHLDKAGLGAGPGQR